MEPITSSNSHKLNIMQLAQLIAQVRTTTPENGTFKVTLVYVNEYTPERPQILRTGTSSNIKALNRINRTDISPRSIKDGYTLKGAYLALLSDTKIWYPPTRRATAEELQGLFFICDTLNLRPAPQF